MVVRFKWRGKKSGKACGCIYAEKTESNGIQFASKAEARRYNELCLLELAGEITNLECHPRFELEVAGEIIGRYTPDFAYDEKGTPKRIVEEVKGGYIARGYGRDYPLRKRLFKALFPQYEHREIKV